MKRVVAFGEIMLRLCPEGYYRLSQANSFVTAYTGAEVNACGFLSYNDIETEFVTKLPKNDIVKCALATMNRFRVGYRHIVWGGDRMGTYYLERGASQRPSKVLYDRKYSSISMAKPEDFDWDTILEGADVFLTSGITAALGGHLPQICLEACKTARKKGITVFFDLNYRANLWTKEEARATMETLMPYIDVVTGNEEDAEKMLGIVPGNSDVTGGKLDKQGYTDVASQIVAKYGCKAVGFTLRTSYSASDNGWAGMAYADGKAHFSKEYKIHLVDRVGGGDSFTSGLIYSYLQGYDWKKSVEFAVASSCLKQTIELDYNLSTVEEITKLMNGDGSGRVQR